MDKVHVISTYGSSGLHLFSQSGMLANDILTLSAQGPTFDIYRRQILSACGQTLSIGFRSKVDTCTERVKNV